MSFHVPDCKCSLCRSSSRPPSRLSMVVDEAIDLLLLAAYWCVSGLCKLIVYPFQKFNIPHDGPASELKLDEETKTSPPLPHR